MKGIYACVDPQFAKTLVVKINCEERKVFGYIEISKHQDDCIARATLAEAKNIIKDLFWLYPKAGLELYEEQKRRGSSDAYKTAQVLWKDIEKYVASIINPSCENVGSFWTQQALLDLAMVELSLEKFETVSTLSIEYCLAKKEVNTIDPILFPYYLERLGEYAALAQLPIA